MALNFRILIHRNSDNLHLKLLGDFDGSSAHEVLESLRKNYQGISKIFIHTNSLNEIHPFGRNVFHNNLDFVNGKSISLLFTGENAGQLAPKGSKLCGV